MSTPVPNKKIHFKHKHKCKHKHKHKINTINQAIDVYKSNNLTKSPFYSVNVNLTQQKVRFIV